MSDETAGVGPVDGSVRPVVYAKAEDLAQVKGCNGVGVWCENPSIYDADCRPPLSLVPLFDIDELWRVAARAAEIERSKVHADVAAERDIFRTERLDLALLVGRLIRRLRAARAGEGIAAGDAALEQLCIGYLKRKGLTSPLRDEQPTEPPATCQRVLSDGKVCGLKPGCPDCGSSLVDVPEGA